MPKRLSSSYKSRHLASRVAYQEWRRRTRVDYDARKRKEALQREARILAKLKKERKLRREMGAHMYEMRRMRKDLGAAYNNELNLQFGKSPNFTSNPRRYKKR